MKVSIEVITPEKAAEYLGLNENFRKISPRRIAQYARDLSAGAWDENGESIKFDTTGTLVDGQHRLTACAAVGLPFTTVVVRDVRRKNLDNIDGGMNRTFPQLLASRGETNVLILSSALTHLTKYKKTGKFYSGGVVFGKSELSDVLDKNPQIRASINKVRGFFAISSYPSLFVALHYVFSENSDTATADAFFEKLVDGLNLTELDARTHFRNRMIINMQSKSRLFTIEVAALTIKAWNAFIEERPVKTLKWTSVGDNAECFPTIMAA